MAPPTAPADKRFRRAHVKPARRRKAGLRRVWLAVKAAVLLTAALYGGWRATGFVLGAPALQVSRITVRGNDRLATGEVLAIVDELRGRNLLTVDLDERRERLLASPWVEEATLRRLLPSRVDVRIVERRPIGIGRIGRTLYLFDAEGVVIDEFGPNHAAFDLPIVDGLVDSRPGRVTTVDPDRARLAARVIASLESRPDLAERVSQIDVADVHDAVVMLEGETVLLRLGDREFAERIQGYLDLAPTLRERVERLDYVDLRFDERLYVRPLGRKAKK